MLTIRLTDYNNSAIGLCPMYILEFRLIARPCQELFASPLQTQAAVRDYRAQNIFRFSPFEYRRQYARACARLCMRAERQPRDK